MRQGQGEFFISSKDVFDRLVLAQIIRVDPDNNECSIRYLDSIGDVDRVDINLPFASAGAQVFAGIRYMPEVGDIVIVGLRADYSPQIVGFKIINFAQLTENAKDGKTLFRKLRPGEIAISTKGGAEIYWSKDGYLFLAGRSNSLIFDIAKNRIYGVTGTWQVDAGDVEYKIGNVRRTVGGISLPVSGITGFLSEFFVRIKKIITFIFGDVVDDAGVQKKSKFGSDLIMLLEWLGFKVEIDLAGNLVLKLSNVDIESDLSWKIKTLSYIVNSVNIQLGSESATIPAVLGTPLVNLLVQIATANVALINASTLDPATKTALTSSMNAVITGASSILSTKVKLE